MMQNIIEQILNNPYIVLGIFTFLAIFIVTLIYLISHKKNKEEDYIYEDEIEETSEPIEKVLKPIVELTEEQKKARMELEKVIEQMEEDLNGNTKEQNDSVMSFEQEQEEKAIISYQELLRSAGKLEIEPKEENSEIKSIIESLEPVENDTMEIETEEVASPVNEVEEPTIEKTPSKFKTTEFVSPVYGIQDSTIDYPTIPNKETLEKRIKSEVILELEKTLNTKCSDLEKNDAFLQALKEFRKNLE